MRTWNTAMQTHTSTRRTFLAQALLVVAACLAPAAIASTAAAEGPYAVIVNKANATKDDEAALKQLVKQLFLKQRTAWPSGAEAKPFARKAGSAEQNAFLKSVLQMTEADLAQHWVSQKQKTGATPPREVSSANMILKLVQKYEGAFGVVKTEEAKAAGDSVRILFTFGG